LKIGVAGFAFGNTMFLALPTYFEKQEPWLDGLRPWFDLLMFLLSIPVVFYAAQEYFINSFKSISKRIWSLDIPIAIGISVLFLKSTHAVFVAHELPYFDSLTGLVFFLLLGKYMQRSVYAATDFEHKYHSFFPIGVTVLTSGKKECIRPVTALQKGDVMLLRPEEIIPTDGIVQQGEAHIDYSFVTGESETVLKKRGAAVYAGGRVKNQVAYIKVEKVMDESFLLQLWKKDTTSTSSETIHAAFANRISKYFTPIVLSISILAGIVWLYLDASRAVEIFVAVLIVACPCAIALSGPFIYGNMVRHFGRMGLLLKNNASIEKIAHTTHWVFDKTGTLTNTEKTKIKYTGNTPLSNGDKQIIRAMVYQSAHPMSKALFQHLEGVPLIKSLAAKHYVGLGIRAQHGNDVFKIGAASFTNANTTIDIGSAIHISKNDNYIGSYHIKQQFRANLKNLFKEAAAKQLSVVSGDGAQDKKAIQKFAGNNVIYRFRQNPFDKIKYIESLQAKGAKVLMMGDGLNDAGALIKSNAGIAVRNDTYMFTPKCDAILEGKRVTALAVFYDGMHKSIRLVYISFGFSLAYNTLGIGIAVVGGLSPIIAAILMPLSSVSVIAFASLSTSHLYKQLKKKLNN
jgi:Cu+-exporting ATPase